MNTGELIAVIMSSLCILLLVYLVSITRRGVNGSSMQKTEAHLAMLERNAEKLEHAFREEISRNREESYKAARQSRDELANSFRTMNESMMANLNSLTGLQRGQLDIFTKQLDSLITTNDQRLEGMRRTVEEKLKGLQDDNAQKLELIRTTVDEKLSSTLEKRLGDSFKIVSERLEQVHKGLGEMQSLAAGVGDLKKVLSNVKTRGVWGEIQLGNILEQLLTADQYVSNVVTKEQSNERVEYAIRLPGKGDDGSEVLLPIDAKFPQDLYQKLVEASEQADQSAVDNAVKQLEARIREEARRICEKYIEPPHTTDFAIMFLPTEGLYAEVAKRPGLLEYVQDNYRIMISGPSTMAAFLNSLSMGFKTLAIQKKSGEVWNLLRSIKTEFGRFGAILEKTQKKLHDASVTIDEATRRTRVIQKKLLNVEQLPYSKSEEATGDMLTDGITPLADLSGDISEDAGEKPGADAGDENGGIIGGNDGC